MYFPGLESGTDKGILEWLVSEMESRTVYYASKNDLVLEQIKKEIMDGALVAGQIYSASKIAERLGVSKMPVNYAILKLSEQGMITQLPNVGFKVNELNWNTVRELMYMKNEMLKLCIRWMIPTVQAEEIETLRRAIGSIFNALKQADKESYTHSTKQFYMLYPQYAKAEKCAEFFERYWDFEGLYAVNMAQKPQELEQLCQDHYALVDAIAQKDLDKALQIADTHLQKSLRYLNSGESSGS